MQWSHYSEAIADCYLHSDSNLLVQACPGSGKTTNIKRLWSLDDKSTVYLVFNKHNQLEAQSKMAEKQGSTVMTLNGLGHRIITSNYGRVVLDTNKTMFIIKNHVKYQGKKQFEKQVMLRKLVDKAKMYCLTAELTEVDYFEMLSLYDLEEYPGMFEDACRVLDISDSTTQTIDFNDQIRMPAIGNMAMPTYHNVLCDEVQDFSPIQALLVSKIKANKFVFVGDTHQSIYGFRGAMNNSMEQFAAQFNCVQLPLSISYRCPTSVVSEAARIYPDIEPWELAIPGSVRQGKASGEVYSNNTLTLCRMNQPLIALAFTLLKQGTACHVRGRDIGEGLIRLVNKQEASSVRELLERLGQWYDTERQKAIYKDDEAKLQSVNDKYNSLLVFTEDCALQDSVDAVITKINNLFEQGKGACLSTIHKAKGLEAKTCQWLGPELAMRIKQQWQQVQEQNCKYVAITRAQEELVYMALTKEK